jgi:hypothetical protein
MAGSGSPEDEARVTRLRSLAISLIRGFDSPGEATEAAVQVLTLAVLAGADLDAINSRLQERLANLGLGPDRRPHSRACGVFCPGHGQGCAPDCPTCLVQAAADDVADGSALAQRAHPAPTFAGPINLTIDGAGSFRYERRVDPWTPPQ